MSVFEQDFENKGVTVETVLSENLPRITVDRKLLKRAFCNLVKNAIEAMETGVKRLKITTGFSNSLDVRISDTGKGIEKEKVKNIFDPMVTSKVYGPGLGLTFATENNPGPSGDYFRRQRTRQGNNFYNQFPCWVRKTIQILYRKKVARHPRQAHVQKKLCNAGFVFIPISIVSHKNLV